MEEILIKKMYIHSAFVHLVTEIFIINVFQVASMIQDCLTLCLYLLKSVLIVRFLSENLTFLRGFGNF